MASNDLRKLMIDRAAGSKPPKWTNPDSSIKSSVESPVYPENNISPSSPTKVPPAWKRHATSNAMEDAYRNNWEPNPMLIRLLQGR